VVSSSCAPLEQANGAAAGELAGSEAHAGMHHALAESSEGAEHSPSDAPTCPMGMAGAGSSCVAASLPGLQTDMPGAMLPSVQAMQMIPFPGKLRLEGEIARRSTAMAMSEVDEAWWEVRARAVMAFYEIYQADRQIAVMEETLDWLRQLGQLATLRMTLGPMVVKTENAFPTRAVYVEVEGRDLGGYVAEARQHLQERLALPSGSTLEWSGQFEAMQRVREKMQLVVPVTLALIFLLLFLHFRNAAETLIVMATLPFALVGGIWLLYLLGYNTSVAVWVGFIARFPTVVPEDGPGRLTAPQPAA
jgi:hypothetical protein